MNNEQITVGSFPYSPGFNPYQRLFTEAIETAGVKVKRIPPEKWFPLQRALTIQCDILHLDWPHDWYRGKNLLSQTIKTSMYFQGLKKIRSRPVVWTAHNLVSHDSSNSSREKQMIQALINECRGIMVMSNSAEQKLRESYDIPECASVKKILHGHYIDCYLNQVSRAEARERFSISEDQFVYLVAGAIKPYKGHKEVIRAFAKCSSESDVLVIAGQISEDFLKNLREDISGVSDHCRGEIRLIPGFIENHELQYYYNATDVTVLPFLDVLNSGSLLLAMSFGSPVIAPKLGSIPEIAPPDHYFGYETSCNPIGALETALKKSKEQLCQKSKSETVKQEIIAFTKSQYDWRSSGENLALWYRSILGSRKLERGKNPP